LQPGLQEGATLTERTAQSGCPKLTPSHQIGVHAETVEDFLAGPPVLRG